MICKVCGSEFNEENFDMCPYCLTPVSSICSEGENVDTISNNEIKNENQICLEEQVDSISTDEMPYDDFEVSEEDLIEENEELNQEQEILIDELGLSVRAVNAFRRAKIYTLNELVEFLAVNSVSDLKNVGAKTVKETEELMDKIRSGQLEIIRNVTEGANEPEKIAFEDISADVDFLSVDALTELGFTNKMVSNLINNNIKCCEGLRSLSKKDLTNIFGGRNMDRIPEVARLLSNDIVYLLGYVLEKYRDSREYRVLLRRACGETLQEIALNPDREEDDIVTRERVRQIENKFIRSLRPFVRELLYILKGSNRYIVAQDILDIFDDDEYDQILMYASKSFEDFEYLDFADIFVDRCEDESAEIHMFSLIKDIVGDGIDLYEYRDDIEDVLVENGFDFIDIDAVARLLKKNGYTLYGSFAVKGRGNYATVCLYIIEKLFPDGIKLSQSETEQSKDLIKLRTIIDERYVGLSVPSSDRALSSTLVRSGLVLRGRGTYISQEHITVDEALLQDIRNYIDTKDSNKVFYNEIYADFEGVLNVMCGVDNYNYLHGILAMRFPDYYEYGRDYLLKNGAVESETESIADRIYTYICEMGRPVSKAELVQEFRGFSNVMIIMPFVNDSRLMQWDYNYYSCTGILKITDEEINVIRACILQLFNDNKGYASDGLLYDVVLDKLPVFLENNQIKSEMNLHYVVAKLFADEMDFKRPHIAEKNRLDISSTQNVALYLLNNPERFSYEQYMGVCDNMKWSRVTAGCVLSDIENDYVRLSIDEYLRNSSFTLSDNVVESVRQLIEDKMEDGILPLLNMELDELPDFEYPWNEFVFETVIRRYFDDLMVIHPTMKDRRYQRGVVVKKVIGMTSYPQIVSRKMRLLGVEKMSESQFLSFLVLHNLARKVIPNELYNSEYIRKDGDFFYAIVDA